MKAKRRYCGPCDEYTNANPCRECGADTDRVPRPSEIDKAMEVAHAASIISTPAAEPTTYGDLKAILAREQRGDWPSRVNPGLTHSQALDVLSAGLATHPDVQRLDDTRRGFLYARNVLKECRSRS